MTSINIQGPVVNGVEGEDSSEAEQKRNEPDLAGMLQRKQERDVDGKKAPNR